MKPIPIALQVGLHAETISLHLKSGGFVHVPLEDFSIGADGRVTITVKASEVLKKLQEHL